METGTPQFKHSDFWRSLLESYLSPAFIMSGEGICFYHQRMKNVIKGRKVLCGCDACLAKLGLSKVTIKTLDGELVEVPALRLPSEKKV